MRKIFTTLTFMFALMFMTNVFASSWTSVYKDDVENDWRIATNSVKVDKKEGGTVEFHANFLKIFSEQGLKQEEEKLSKNGVEKFPQNVRIEMDCIHFKEEGGKIFSSVTDSFYLDEKGEPIPGFYYVDKPVEWHALKQEGVLYELYKIAKKYI